MSNELRRYERCIDVHDLPGIFHYWSNLHILPKLLPFGFSNPDEMFLQALAKELESGPHVPKRFVSLGCGNGDLEIRLASSLTAQGLTNFVIDCLDVNTAMLDRGTASAEEQHLAANINFIQTDLNDWNPPLEYDAAIAHQSLHHLVKLENLFSRTEECLRPEGAFAISDMIGRNGHQRWPEALAIVHEFWKQLPPSYRFNQLFRRYENLYENHDCSGEGFEGVRSQDILPLLLEHFRFDVFIGFGNIIDPFVDRAFGPNFDPAVQWDRDFIDALHARDETEMSAGRLKPTHMLAVLRKHGVQRLPGAGQAGARAAVRPPDREPATDCRVDLVVPPPFEAARQESPHGLAEELAIACERLQETADRVREYTSLEVLVPRFQELELEFAERTAWALKLDNEVGERTTWALRLEEELEERTRWALQLQEELAEQTHRVAELEAQLASYLRNPFRLAAQFGKTKVTR